MYGSSRVLSRSQRNKMSYFLHPNAIFFLTINSQHFLKTYLVQHQLICSLIVNCENDQGPSTNVNIFMSVQTVHLFRPSPPPLLTCLSVQTNIFVSKIWVSCITFITQQQKLILLLSLFEMIALAKYYDLQISVTSVYFQI